MIFASIALIVWTVCGFIWFFAINRLYCVSTRREIFNHLIGGPLIWLGWLFFLALSLITDVIDAFNRWLDAE